MSPRLPVYAAPYLRGKCRLLRYPCMYVGRYMHMYICNYTYAHVRGYVGIYVDVHSTYIHTHRYIYIYIYICMHVYRCVYIYAYWCMDGCMYVTSLPSAQCSWEVLSDYQTFARTHGESHWQSGHCPAWNLPRIPEHSGLVGLPRMTNII